MERRIKEEILKESADHDAFGRDMSLVLEVLIDIRDSLKMIGDDWLVDAVLRRMNDEFLFY